MMSNGMNDIQSLKLVWSVLHSELNARALPPLEGKKGCNTNKHTHSTSALNKIKQILKTNLFNHCNHLVIDKWSGTTLG